MAQNLYLTLPNGAFVRPYVIAYSSSTDGGVSLVSSNDQMVGFIKIDEEKYDLEKLQVHIMNLIRECCESGKKFKQIDWELAFNSFKRD